MAFVPLIYTLLLVPTTAVWGWTFVVVQDAICEILEDGFSSYVVQYCFACQALPFYGEHRGKRHCVLHFPGD